jgi:hypothetical protein
MYPESLGGARLFLVAASTSDDIITNFHRQKDAGGAKKLSAERTQRARRATPRIFMLTATES